MSHKSTYTYSEVVEQDTPKHENFALHKMAEAYVRGILAFDQCAVTLYRNEMERSSTLF